MNSSLGWRWQRLGPWLILGLGLASMFHPMIASGFRLMQSDPFDTRFNHYLLEHAYRCLSRAPHVGSLWNPGFFYPMQNALAFSDTLLSLQPFYAPWRLLGLPPEPAFQAWMLLTAALNFLAAYVFLKKWFCENPLAAALGAFLFSFGNSRAAQLGHQQLLPQFYVVLACHALGYVFSSSGPEAAPGPRRLGVAAFFACFTLQFYAGFYYGVFFALALALALAWALAAGEGRGRLRLFLGRDGIFAGACCLLAAASAWPLAAHYLQTFHMVGRRPFGPVQPMIPTIVSWFSMGGGSLLYGRLAALPAFAALPMGHEHQIGLGIATTAVAAGGFAKGRDRAPLRLIGLTTLSLVLLSIEWPGGFTLWKLVFDWFPGACGMRAVARIGVFLLLPFAVGLAWNFDLAFKKSAAAPLLMAALCLLEQARAAGGYDWRAQRAGHEAVAAQVSRDCSVFLYSPPASAPFAEDQYQIDAMWAQLETGVATLNGYSGNWPPRWPFHQIKIAWPADARRRDLALAGWLSKWRAEPQKVCVVSP